MTPSEAIANFAQEKLNALAGVDQLRQLCSTARSVNGVAVRNGKSLISFCDNDYLGLSQDLAVISAAQFAARDYGAGAGASRLVVGDNPLNEEVERQIARMKSMPAARLFGSGFLANVGTIAVLVGRGDLIVMDELSHASTHAGAKLSGAEVRLFRHNDVCSLANLLSEAQRYARTLVLTETVFSMDGDIAPLNEIDKVCKQYGAWLMTDDAHGFGILKQDNPAPIQMGTLSKAVGTYGGYVCGPPAFTELLTNRARSLIYTTGLPPSVLGATLEALYIIEREPERAAIAIGHAAEFCRIVGLPSPQSTIVPVVLGSNKKTLAASDRLRQEGFMVTAIRPPTVPEGTARLRVTFTSTHHSRDVRRLAEQVCLCLEVN